MNRRIYIIISIIIVVIGLLSLYSTFAFNREDNEIETGDSDINLTYSLKNDNGMNVSINKNEEKYIDMNLKNVYDESVRYGIYYIVNEPKSLPSGLIVSVDKNSKNNSEEILKPNEEKIVTIKIVNNSEYNVSLTLGSVVGFIQGDIRSLLEKNMILIK